MESLPFLAPIDSSATPLLITERSVNKPTKVILFLAPVEDIKPDVFNDFDVKSEVQVHINNRS